MEIATQKEAKARLKINELLEKAGWRFFEKTTKGFIDFLLPKLIRKDSRKYVGAMVRTAHALGADAFVTIPMSAGIDSFSVNAAAAILLYGLSVQKLGF